MMDLQLIVVTFLLNLAMDLIPRGHPNSPRQIKAIGDACKVLAE